MSPTKVSSVRLDQELLSQAKKLGLNLSQILTEALILRIQSCNTPVVHSLDNPENQHEIKGSLVAYRPVEPGESSRFRKPVAGVRIPSLALSGSHEDILANFREILEVDLNRTEATIQGHLKEVKRILAFMGSDPITKGRIRSYLRTYRESPDHTYNNVLKSLRVFLRECLDREDLVKGFKFRSAEGSPVRVPEKEELQRFYEALEDPLAKLYFLILASSGLRRAEALDLTLEDISLERRMIIPGKQSSTKRTYITFYSPEVDEFLNQPTLPEEPSVPVLIYKKDYFNDRFLKASEISGVKITPQILREWFCSEMGRLGVPDRYVDGFCGRVPKSVLAKHYSDYSQDKLQEIYEKAGLRVLS